MEDIIKNRRSTRHFLRKEVSSAIIREIVEAGTYAPTALNSQSYEIVVINDEELKNKISEIHEYSSFLKNADKLIIVYWHKNNEFSEDKYNEISEYFKINSLQNICLSMQLQAEALNIGTCQVGLDKIDRAKLKTIVPYIHDDNFEPFILLGIGYKDIEKEKYYQEENKKNRNKKYFVIGLDSWNEISILRVDL